jgi:predicted nucleotidyltransferase
MDKNGAIEIVKNYIDKIRETETDISEAWLFGSYAKETHNSNSDIDLAIVFADKEPDFEKEVLFMTLRNGDETLIEPHLYSKKDFLENTPIISQIKNFGMQLI